MADMQTRKSPSSLFFTLPLLVAVLFVYINRISLLDWYNLRSYVAPAPVAALATETTMNPYGTKLFYVNHPSIEDKVAFNSSCRENEQTIVLGCYIRNRGIHILDVTDTRLDGVEQVTAAHEMLHAAYQRLGSSEKTRVDKQLNDAYAMLKDQRILDNIESYKKAKADITNELHSILGTEVANLSPGLETYYQKYFNDRSKIVAFSAKYEAELTGRKDKVTEDDKQLSSLEAQIKLNNSTLDVQSNELRDQKNNLDQLRRSDVPAYNAGVPAYNGQVVAYNSLINSTNQLIAQYRSLLESRNSLVADLQTLSKALDSRITTRSKL